MTTSENGHGIHLQAQPIFLKPHKSLQSHLNQRVEELEAEIEQAKAESEKYRQKFKGVIYYIYYILF